EDDAVLQQPREDVVGAFPAVGLFDHHRDQLSSWIRHKSGIGPWIPVGGAGGWSVGATAEPPQLLYRQTCPAGLSAGLHVRASGCATLARNLRLLEQPRHRFFALNTDEQPGQRAFLLEPRTDRL